MAKIVVVVDLLCGGAGGTEFAPVHRHPHLQQNKKNKTTDVTYKLSNCLVRDIYRGLRFFFRVIARPADSEFEIFNQFCPFFSNYSRLILLAV